MLTREDYRTVGDECSAFGVQVPPDNPRYAAALWANLRPEYAVKEAWPLESQACLERYTEQLQKG